MPRPFAVIRRRTAAYGHGQPLEAQRDWRAHADFMNALHREGFVRFAGPLDGTDEVLLIFLAEDAAAIEERLAADPWTGTLLETARIMPWQLRLGALG